MDGEQLNAARQRGEVAKCLVVRCHSSKSVFGHVIPCKGMGEVGIVVDVMLQDLEWMGHNRIIVKSDNEPAIQVLARRAIELAKIELKDMDQVAKRDPIAHGSMTNGGTEVGARLLRGLFRTDKLCL